MRHEWAAEAAQRMPAEATFVAAADNDPQLTPLLDGIFANSPFLGRLLTEHPDILRLFVQSGPRAALDGAQANLITHVDDGDIQALMLRLRRAKARAALAIGIADITAQWNVDQVVVALSGFADLCVRKAVAGAMQDALNLGRLTSADPAQSGYVVLGVGKLGAHELNYSSDIDLFVLFDADRLPYVGKKSPQEFAVDLTKSLVRILQERTADGYVFRTDLRLRPDPASTSIAVSREAAQSYYENYGQNWERAALIKARFIAGDGGAAREFLDGLKPFIWRKSLDFYALQDIHSIKRQIYAHKGGSQVAIAGHNIKVGRGGIREIEFFVQTQQLIWGGRIPEARIQTTLGALETLQKLGFITDEARDDLTVAYRYLRKVEHRLQMIADEQTQTLPSQPGPLAELAAFLGYPDCESFAADMGAALRTVETHYAALFEDAPSLAVGGNLVFTGTEDDSDTMETLRRLGFQHPSAAAAAVRAWHHGRYRAMRSDRARQLLTELIPPLLTAFGKTTQPDVALIRFDQTLAQLSSGVQLLSTFHANPELMDLVAEIMGDAPRLAEMVTRNTALLDYVLEPEFYASLPDIEGMRTDLAAALTSGTAFEEILDLTRRWANDQRFRIGVQLLRGRVTPEVAAAKFSDAAVAVLNSLTPHVEADFVRQYGTVPGGAIAIVAYGKLGSHELTPTSDLDIVVVYDHEPEALSVGGPKSLSAPVYYIRFVQRLTTALTALTREGALYSVDHRLRPDGDKGPLAAPYDGFANYHRDKSWTWEHMALTRARVVYGPENLTARLDAVILDTLKRARDPNTLRQEIGDMRARMRKEHPGDNAWDLKHRPGGMIDAEFLVQFHVLHSRSGLRAADRGMVAVVEALRAAGHIDGEDAAKLIAGLLLWLRLQVMLRLSLADDAPSDLSLGLKNKLTVVAEVPTFEALEALMKDTAAQISTLFQQTIVDRSE